MKRKTGIFAAMIMIVILVGLGMVVWNWCQDPKENVVDETCFENLQGDYQAIESEDVDYYWHLYIGMLEDEKYYLSIYDNAAGNPGIEGKIIQLDDKMIKIKIDFDYFEEMPAAWELEDDTFIILQYQKEENGMIILTNAEKSVPFEKN